ncbi:MAG: ABC transporter ATP-binding protein, partial [Actinomyces sp.]|nr:ABC transporter ATP-binding protein [Actinomyces sp.]
MTDSTALECIDVSVDYGSFRAVDGVSFSLKSGQITALLGPSGCGKSTLLRAIAGLERPQQGDIQWAGLSILRTPTYRRGFGLMFQDGQLFPHRSVEGNVAYGLRGLPAAERSARAVEVLEIVGLEGFGPRSIDSLSGGQAQRVALARALAPRPRLLLLDEPLSALDRSMRESLSIELREIITGEGITSIYVTHDQDEAFTVADQIGVMIAGHLRRLDSPEAVWEDPGD